MGGCPIRRRVNISIYFAVFIACILVLDRTGLASYALLCIFIHESGHFLTLKIMKIPVEEVSFKLFGINITLRGDASLSYRQEIALALAGSTANFITCILTYTLYSAEIFKWQAGVVFAFSLLLGGFNLLPIGSLDGGRALEALLCRKTNCCAAEKIVNVLSVVFIVPLVIAGVYMIYKTGYNFSLLMASIYLAISLVFKGGFTRD